MDQSKYNTLINVGQGKFSAPFINFKKKDIFMIKFYKKHNNTWVALAPSELEYMRINPLTMAVERLKLGIATCYYCNGNGCGRCGYTGIKESFGNVSLDNYMWEDVSGFYKYELGNDNETK